ncbi:uncharacterized protein LOC144617995 [Crassostrea virginica]
MVGALERLIGIPRCIFDSILFDARHYRITHEVLSTFMAEDTTIINARPLVPVSTDSDSSWILVPSTLSTQKTSDPVEDFHDLDLGSIYTSQWKFVQHLANQFWRKWRREYLQNLQTRTKWKTIRDNVQVGDVVLLKDSSLHQNNWPAGLIERTFPSRDGLGRKIEVRTIREAKPQTYVRPVTEIVVLCHSTV